MSYDLEYVEFDELGMSSIKCQCCGKEVIRRGYAEIKIKSEPERTEKVLTMSKLSHYRRVPLMLSDGSIIHLHMCSQCEKNETLDFSQDENKCDKVISQIKNTFIKEEKANFRHEDDIKEISNKWDSMKAIKSFKSDVSFKEALEKGRLAVDEFKKSEKVR